jgi:hypothetical protein
MLGKGYQKGSWLFNPWTIMSIHGFIVIDGKGYGRFEIKDRPAGTAQIRDTDLQGYPNVDPSTLKGGDFYSVCVPLMVDDGVVPDLAKFRQGVRDYIAKQTASPGVYAIRARDCHAFVMECIREGIIASNSK